MTTVTDNDLLILSDEDTKKDDLVMEETTLNEDISPSSEEMITFGDDYLDWKAEEINLDNSSLSQDDSVSLDLTWGIEINNDSSEELNIAEENVTETEESTFDLWGFDSAITEETPVIQEEQSLETEDSIFGWDDASVNIWTMEEILSKAIADLEARSETISDEKSRKEENIADLKSQIEDLEIKVKTANDEVAELDSEKAMITKNVKSLERMKKTNDTTDIKVETSRKVHNTKRKQAA